MWRQYREISMNLIHFLVPGMCGFVTKCICHTCTDTSCLHYPCNSNHPNKEIQLIWFKKWPPPLEEGLHIATLSFLGTKATSTIAPPPGWSHIATQPGFIWGQKPKQERRQEIGQERAPQWEGNSAGVVGVSYIVNEWPRIVANSIKFVDRSPCGAWHSSCDLLKRSCDHSCDLQISQVIMWSAE